MRCWRCTGSVCARSGRSRWYVFVYFRQLGMGQILFLFCKWSNLVNANRSRSGIPAELQAFRPVRDPTQPNRQLTQLTPIQTSSPPNAQVLGHKYHSVSGTQLTNAPLHRQEFRKNLDISKKDFTAIEYLVRKGHRQLEMYSNPGIRNIL